MSKKEQVLRIADKNGFISASDLEVEGISRNYLYKLEKEGNLTRTARGLYRTNDALITEYTTLAEVSKRHPKAVICLISALEFHKLTTQIPHEIWIALPKGTWRPNTDNTPLNVTFLSGKAYSFGIQEVNVQGISVKIYNPAKSVADCFKFRNKIGLDVAIEALKETWRTQSATMDELSRAAKICRVDKIMRPYLEAIV